MKIGIKIIIKNIGINIGIKKSTYKNLPVLNDVDAYLICKVIDIKKMPLKKSDPIKKIRSKGYNCKC